MYSKYSEQVQTSNMFSLEKVPAEGLVGRFQGLHSNNDYSTWGTLSGFNALLL